jgi:hypothetical protein
MTTEQILSTIIQEYGTQIWLTFVTFVVTGFVLTVMKNFVQDVVYYFKARMSDIGFGQRIYWRGEIYIVEKIHFKFIEIKDDKKIIRIPTSIYINGPVEFPVHRHDDFDERKYHEPPWDGVTERREDRNK